MITKSDIMQLTNYETNQHSNIYPLHSKWNIGYFGIPFIQNFTSLSFLFCSKLIWIIKNILFLSVTSQEEGFGIFIIN